MTESITQEIPVIDSWGCSSSPATFIITEYSSDSRSDSDGANVNELGSGRGSVAAYAYGDGGATSMSAPSDRQPPPVSTEKQGSASILQSDLVGDDSTLNLEPLARRIPAGAAIILTMRSGDVLSGVVVEWGNDYVIVNSADQEQYAG